MRTRLITDSQDATVGMRFAGIEAVAVNTPEQTLEALDAAIKDMEIGLILLTDRVATPCYKAVMEKRLTQDHTLILMIPDPGFAFTDHIATYVRESVGIRF